MDATAAELASGRSFDTLSLREVAKLAGIAPTSFYRHFHDMEGLGLALIEEHGEGLVTLMHDVRDQTSNGRSLIRASVETLFEYIFSNQGISRMILQDDKPAANIFAAGEIMAGNILGKGYLAGIGMAIGTTFGRIAGEEAARHALR